MGLPTAIDSRRPIILAAAVLLVAAGAVAMAFGSGWLWPPQVAQPVSEASAAPTATASPDLPPLTGALPPGSLATVLAEVEMRERPTAEAPLLTTVPAGQTLYILGPDGAARFGPIFADGALWYVAAYALNFDAWPSDHDWLAGYVAVEVNGAGRVELLPASCPDAPPSRGLVVTMTAWARVTCYGDRELVLEGILTVGFLIDEFGMVPWDASPEWLARRPYGNPLALYEFDSAEMFDMVLAPDLETRWVLNDQNVRVTGHFDDRAAAGCVIRTGDPLVEQPREAAQFWCREQFVVTKVERADATTP